MYQEGIVNKYSGGHIRIIGDCTGLPGNSNGTGFRL